MCNFGQPESRIIDHRKKTKQKSKDEIVSEKRISIKVWPSPNKEKDDDHRS
jgi:hypothetical protein